MDLLDEQENMFQIYRSTKIGEALVSVVEEYVKNGIIEPEVKAEVLKAFDKAVSLAFYKIESVKNDHKRQLSGDHCSHNHVDNVWSFILKDVKMQFGSTDVETDLLQVICIDSELNPYVRLQREEQEMRDASNTTHRKRRR